MDASHTPPIDAAELVRQLDAEAIRQRLEALQRERKALMVLLRAAIRARPTPQREDRHAD
jgi:hypothetical protein